VVESLTSLAKFFKKIQCFFNGGKVLVQPTDGSMSIVMVVASKYQMVSSSDLNVV